MKTVENAIRWIVSLTVCGSLLLFVVAWAMSFSHFQRKPKRQRAHKVLIRAAAPYDPATSRDDFPMETTEERMLKPVRAENERRQLEDIDRWDRSQQRRRMALLKHTNAYVEQNQQDLDHVLDDIKKGRLN